MELIVLLLAVGAVSGFLAGLFGVGGGIIMTPALFYVFSTLKYSPEYAMHMAVATSLGTILFTSVRSLRAHAKHRVVHWKALKTLGPWMGLGATVGAIGAHFLSTKILGLIFAAIAPLVGVQIAFGKQNSKHTQATDLSDGVVKFLLSWGAGFLSVFMGVGGGAFGTMILTLYKQPIHTAIATSSGFGFIIALPSVLLYMAIGWHTPVGQTTSNVGYVNLMALLCLIPSTLLTVPFGVRLSHALNPTALRKAFCLFLFVVSGTMIAKLM